MSLPTKTYRGTWDELMSRRSEIAPDAVLEMRVYESDAPPQVSARNSAAIALLNQWIAEDATDDPGEVREADTEVNDLMDNLNRNRVESGKRPLFP